RVVDDRVEVGRDGCHGWFPSWVVGVPSPPVGERRLQGRRSFPGGSMVPRPGSRTTKPGNRVAAGSRAEMPWMFSRLTPRAVTRHPTQPTVTEIGRGTTGSKVPNRQELVVDVHADNARHSGG